MTQELSPVYFYVANLITSSRILFAVIGFAFVMINPWIFFVCYAISAFNDIADGHYARKYNQVSKLGSVLDMVTDRASTTCLIMVLGIFYPNYIHLFLLSVGMDIMSHFAHVVSQLTRGVENHKQINASQGWILRMYYTNRLVLGFLCGFNEAFFTLLYLNHFWAGPAITLGSFTLNLVPLLIWITVPGMLVKQSINFVQFKQACVDIVNEIDEPKRLAALSAADGQKKK